MSSPDSANGSPYSRVPDKLPSPVPAMWRLLKLAFQHEPWLLVAAFGLTLAGAVPNAMIALWLKFLADGVVEGDRTLLLAAALGLGGSAMATWFLTVISTRISRRFRDRITIALESHVAALQARVSTIAHQERQDYLDRLAVLRDQVFVLDHMYLSLFTTCGFLLQLVVTLGLLATVHPALLLLAVFAAPLVITSSWRPAVERRVQEREESWRRRAAHLFNLATTAPPGKEVRVTGNEEMLIRERRAAWERWYGPVSRSQWTTAAWHTAAWAIFGLAYTGAIVFVASGLEEGVGNVLLVAAAGRRLAGYISSTVGEIGFLRGIWMDGSQRLVWLENYAAAIESDEDLDPPAALREGIRFDDVSFVYPGSDRTVLESVNLELPAGAVVAVVGENGAGKSTLVKLLCKMYEPTSGRILVDGQPLARIHTEGWRERVAGAFQDFFRFEFLAQTTVGLGDVPRVEDRPAVVTAVGRAGAGDVVTRLPSELATQLGPTWPGGVEVSFGQWQKLALARGFMRDEPLLLVLDEPTAALDAETEHSLFERFAAAARGEDGVSGPAHRASSGRITVLVSHRFSTVRMADLIVVLEGSRLAEVGTHEELLHKGGSYAELYRIQAKAYR